MVWSQADSDYGENYLDFSESHNTCEGPASVCEMYWDWDFQLICQLLLNWASRDILGCKVVSRGIGCKVVSCKVGSRGTPLGESVHCGAPTLVAFHPPPIKGGNIFYH